MYRYVRRVVRAGSRRFALTFGVGALITLMLQFSFFERSALGQLDRTMLDSAFELRRDLVRAQADPVLFIDIDDDTVSTRDKAATGWPRAPEPRTDRALVASLLEYVR
ncbi:MAG TPA: hypothetical protein VIO94_17910, partial [Phenylobacterium sp.]